MARYINPYTDFGFKKLFGEETSKDHKAELANFNLKERDAYEESLKAYRDMKGVIETAFNDGKKIGIEKGIDIGIEKYKFEIVKKCIGSGFTDEKIHELTGLTFDVIKDLRKNSLS